MKNLSIVALVVVMVMLTFSNVFAECLIKEWVSVVSAKDMAISKEVWKYYCRNNEEVYAVIIWQSRSDDAWVVWINGVRDKEFMSRELAKAYVEDTFKFR